MTTTFAFTRRPASTVFFLFVFPQTELPKLEKELSGSSPKVCTVIGFPFGYETTPSKVLAASQALADGAEELDMVLSISRLIEGDYESVAKDISQVVQSAGSIPVKVILETSYLNEDQIVAGCKISKENGAAFVKTSTGYSSSGADPQIVRLMRETVGESLGVKASGGIRNLDTAKEMIAAGANRLGTSQSVSLIQGLNTEGNY